MLSMTWKEAPITKLACQSCHQVGRPNADGSARLNCNACHLRHDFSLARSANPRPATAATSAPIIPILKSTKNPLTASSITRKAMEWNWNQKPGRLGVQDMPGATCPGLST